MPVTIYHFPPSAPSRCAVLVARALDIDIQIKQINLFEKEQLSPDYIKINPQHTVPTLDDNGFILWESRAIAGYLVDTYGKDDKLYPKDTKQRAIVNQRLYFDATSVYPKIREICFPVLFLGETLISDSKKSQLNNTFEFLDQFLDGHDYVCGDNLTIADFSCVSSVSSIQAVGWNVSPYKNVDAWIKRCAANIPGYSENQKGANIFGNAVKSKLKPGQL